MRALSTRLHAILDVVFSLVLLAAPLVLNLTGEAAWVAWGVGGLVLLYSLLTDYELGALKRMQVPVHLWLDALSGVFLAISPWLFAFYHRVWIPHLAAGLLLLVVSVLSQTIPGYERRRRG